MLEYWQNPEATPELFTEDGWIRTGDIAVRDEDGFYWIKDRIKDSDDFWWCECLSAGKLKMPLATHPLPS